ncbi:RNA polymerase sigma factor [Teredinibacter purpureus]|uniref:RNA polymerase sigma factor n=1 Tax=Teredinibacter purpureus TaxID=2731756 RepID=UPI0006971AE1|nr:sigma-70 family RNA polymerase sigma factor [Teredinibacter purpureus]
MDVGNDIKTDNGLINIPHKFSTPEEEFWFVWTNNRKVIYKRCFFWMKGNQHDAEDAMSRAALRGVSKYSNYAGKLHTPLAWIICLTRNICMDIWRENRKYLEEIGQSLSDDHTLCESTHYGENPEALLNCEELSFLVTNAINRMPQKMSITYQLRVLNEWPYSDIAATLNITQDNARKRVQQAKKELKDAIEK